MFFFVVAWQEKKPGGSLTRQGADDPESFSRKLALSPVKSPAAGPHRRRGTSTINMRGKIKNAATVYGRRSPAGVKKQTGTTETDT
jgi:hypothetical protein